MRRHSICIVMASILLGCGTAPSDRGARIATPGAEQAHDTQTQDSPEYQLALLDKGRPSLPRDDISITRIGYLLDNLSGRTGVPRRTLAEHAYAAHNVIRSKCGKEVSGQQFLETFNANYDSYRTTAANYGQDNVKGWVGVAVVAACQ